MTVLKVASDKFAAGSRTNNMPPATLIPDKGRGTKVFLVRRMPAEAILFGEVQFRWKG